MNANTVKYIWRAVFYIAWFLFFVLAVLRQFNIVRFSWWLVLSPLLFVYGTALTYVQIYIIYYVIKGEHDIS